MALVLTIAGVTKQLKAGSLSISQTANGRATASFKVVSLDASYRPVIDAEVLFVEDGTRIFGGLVQRPEEVGVIGTGAHPGIVTTINAVDFNAYADRRAVNGTMPAGTMSSHLSIIQIYLAAFGVTLDGGQVTGPAMPALIHEYMQAADVLNEIARLTSVAGSEPYVWRIDEFKVLSMYQPSTVPAPFDVTTDTPAEVVGDITVVSTREHYANSIIVLVPSRTEMNRVETFTGDGATTAFPLNYHMDANRGYVTSNGVFETLSTGGGGTWDYDPVTNTITRLTAPVAGAPVSITFDGTLATFGLASDAGEIAAVGHWEKVFRVESVPNAATAQAIAVAELANALALHTTVRYRTLEPLIRPGQTQTITVPSRNLSATGMIVDVVLRDLRSDQLLIREVTVVTDSTQSNLRRNFRDVYKKWSDDTTGRGNAVVSGTTVPTVPPTAPPAGGPAPPVLSVQFNNTGVFGGDAAFIYNPTTNSLVCGGGGSSITAAAPESCQVFGYNCHITD